MASSPIQSYKVFLRAGFFDLIIIGCIALSGPLIFIEHSTLPTEAIWPYILADMSSAYKGCVIIGLLGMAMSTADSSLHTAAIMVNHDIVESIRGIKAGPYVHQLRLTQLTALPLGLWAMATTLYHSNLFKLSTFVFYHVFPLYNYTVVPLFILAVFGFWGSTHTALIGMAIGTLVHYAWEKWVIPKTGLVAGILPVIAKLAMTAAHYLLPQPAGKGWIEKNDQQKRMEQLIRAFKKYKKR